MSNNKTPLYKEALLEVETLKKAAIEEAKKSIVESLTPLIKKEMDKKISNKSLFVEANEDPMDLEQSNLQSDATQQPSNETTSLTTSAMTSPLPDAGQNLSLPASNTSTEIPQQTQPLETPINPSPGLLQIPMPDEEGNIVVDIKSLFDQTPVGSEPLQAIQDSPDLNMGNQNSMNFETDNSMNVDNQNPTSPIQPENPMPQLENFNKELNDIKKILIESKKNNLIEQKIVEKKLIDLYSNLQKMRENKQINEKFAIEAETYLDIAYNKIKEERKKESTYSKSNLKEHKMNKLREFAMSLFEEATTGFDEKTSEKTDEGKDDKQVKAAGDHAMKVSKSNVKDPGKAESLKVESADNVDEDMESLEEELKSLFETEEEVVEEAKDAEVVGDKVGKGMNNVGGGKMNSDAAVMESKKVKKDDKKAKKADLSKKLKTLKEEQEKVLKALKECGMESEVHADKVVINVGSKSDVEFVGDESDDLDTDFADVEDDMDSETEDMDMSDDSLNDEDEDVIVDDDEDEVVDSESVVKESKKLPIVEAKKELNETKFLLAKSLYVNKLLARENLSKNQKRKIVEYLDSARSINEAKEIYFRVKNLLENVHESQERPSFKTSSASNGTKRTMNESVQQSKKENDSLTQRWQVLAGIKK